MLDDFAAVVHFVRKGRDFIREARASAAAAGAEHVTAEQRIERTAWALTLFGCVAVPFASPVAAVFLLDITHGDASFRVLLGLFLSLLASCVYIPGGAALGLTLAPQWFVEGPAGGPWRRVFGTRVNSATFALFAIGLTAGVSALLIYMAPTNVW